MNDLEATLKRAADRYLVALRYKIARFEDCNRALLRDEEVELQPMLVLADQIKSSGASFGFDDVSMVAFEIEARLSSIARNYSKEQVVRLSVEIERLKRVVCELAYHAQNREYGY